MPPIHNPRSGSVHGTSRWLTLLFIIVWVIMHGAMFLGIWITSYISGLLAALVLIPGSYGGLLRWYLPTPGTWAVTTVGGGVLVLVLGGIIHPSDLLGSGMLGIATGMANLPLLPTRGLRKVLWPLCTTVAGIAAYGVMMRLTLPDGMNFQTAVMARVVVSGALYGLITGPVLAVLLHDRHPTWLEQILQDDHLPRA